MDAFRGLSSLVVVGPLIIPTRMEAFIFLSSLILFLIVIATAR